MPHAVDFPALQLHMSFVCGAKSNSSASSACTPLASALTSGARSASVRPSGDTVFGTEGAFWGTHAHTRVHAHTHTHPYAHMHEFGLQI